MAGSPFVYPELIRGCYQFWASDGAYLIGIFCFKFIENGVGMVLWIGAEADTKFVENIF